MKDVFLAPWCLVWVIEKRSLMNMFVNKITLLSQNSTPAPGGSKQRNSCTQVPQCYFTVNKQSFKHKSVLTMRGTAVSCKTQPLWLSNWQGICKFSFSTSMLHLEQKVRLGAAPIRLLWLSDRKQEMRWALSQQVKLIHMGPHTQYTQQKHYKEGYTRWGPAARTSFKMYVLAHG